jgi:16S rRNA (cytidine1402-2'-O)-methyltransferase
MTSSIAQVAQWIGAAQQQYPAGCLYVVATPIGNMADISVRALHVLSLVDAIACEDTRHTQGLLRHYGLEKPLLAVHEHNEEEMAERIVARLQAGERIAYVSDAGTPGVSDPGARLVAACQRSGLRCMPLPGASSVTAAMSVSGAVAAMPEQNGFVFQGFLDTKAAARARQIELIASESRSVVLLEAPHRIAACLQALGALGERLITIAREISKQFEQIATLPAQQAAAWLASDERHAKGEFVIVIHPSQILAEQDEAGISPQALKVLQLLLQELPLKTAVKLASEITLTNRNALYEKALALKNAD